MKRLILPILSLAVIAAGCSRDEETLGPDAYDVFGPFELTETLTVSADSADFAAGETVHFSAKFTVVRDWTITIKGDSSNITKTISGTSNEINASNATWTGNSDIPTFLSETATATFTTADGDTSISVPFKILSAKPLEAGGIVVQDYDGTVASVSNPASGDSANFVSETAFGGTYFTMTGIDRNSDYWIGEQGNTAGADDFFQVPAGTAAEDLYFNMYIYGYAKPETQLEIAFREADGDEGDDIHAAAGDDIFSYKVDPSWVGWRLVSFKYSECLRSTNPGLGDSGNAEHEPDRITAVVMALLAKNASPSSVAKLSMEYAVFTVGGPLVY